MRPPAYVPGQPRTTDLNIVTNMVNTIEITSPSVAYTELRVEHGLRRIPRGYTVIKGAPGVPVTVTGITGTVTLTPSTANNAKSVNDRVTCDWYDKDVDFAVVVEAYGIFSNGNVTATATIGHQALRAGSITGIEGIFDVLVRSASGAPTVVVHVKKNGTTVYQLNSPTLSSAGVTYLSYTSQAAGIDTFVAGDILNLYFELSGGGGAPAPDAVRCHARMELTYTESFTEADTTYTAALSGVTGNVTETDTSAVTAWDTQYLYLKFKAVSTALTIAVW